MASIHIKFSVFKNQHVPQLPLYQLDNIKSLASKQQNNTTTKQTPQESKRLTFYIFAATMPNTTNCSLTSVPQPPTTSAACAVPNVGNNSAILTSCCNTNGAAIIGSYGDANFNTASDCYSYCNITEQAGSNNTVLTVSSIDLLLSRFVPFSPKWDINMESEQC